MHLVDIRIRNFRTVAAEQRISLPGPVTIVGPNNTGKTNILKAVQTLFTGYDNRFGYDRSKDLTFGAGRARTSIIGLFRGDPDGDDAEVYRRLDELHELQGTSREGHEVSLTLYFTDTGTPVYNFFPNIRRPTNPSQNARYSRLARELTTFLISSFELHYVPSAKSFGELYRDLLTPFLRQKVAATLEPHLEEIHEELESVAEHLNAELSRAGLSTLSASFDFPSGSVEELLSSFDFMLSDPEETSISSKGMGIQSTALLASFLWITREESQRGKSVVWLLEEPESYLHPELSEACRAILERLEGEALVLRSTHSLSFVPQDPTRVVGTVLGDENRTRVSTFRTYEEATRRLRESLGVRFSDFYNLDVLNVLVEGPSDRELLNWLLEVLTCESFGWSRLRSSKLLDFGGVRHLAGFLRATWEFIRTERAAISVFDGDEAGSRERQALQRYFGQKEIGFESNLDFVSTRDRFSIEGLFPDTWIVEIYQEHQTWFESFSLDVEGRLEPFRVKDGRKQRFLSLLRQKAEAEPNLEWSGRFQALCGQLDSALERQLERLEGG